MTVRLIGSAMPNAPLVDSIRRFTSDFEIMNSAPLGTPPSPLPMGFLTLRQAQNDGLNCQIKLPPHWQTMNITISWASLSLATGPPTFRADVLQHSAGDVLGGSGAVTFNVGPTFAADSAATEYVRIDSLIRSNVVVDPSKALSVRVFRLASGGDGLAGNIGAFQLKLTRAS